jgi:hypothetical protein
MYDEVGPVRVAALFLLHGTLAFFSDKFFDGDAWVLKK